MTLLDAPADPVVDTLARLDAALGEGRWTIAVSGGVDSMTLATLAHRRLATPPRMVHATSPAVPSEARRRVERHAGAEGWRLEVIDAGEFADADYRANPVNRCYFCKSRLYGSIDAVIRAAGGGLVASGTNRDDLGDFRPGLKAAAENGVRHPFVEAGIGKAEIRALARAHGLEFAALPAQPCLSSRVETGLAIQPADLAFIDALETELRTLAPTSAVRVRLRAAGVCVETDCAAALWPRLAARAATACDAARRIFLGVEAYRMGSAFLKDAR
ncbi:adenine nucleotide alpha hydrolase [Acuticoccus sp. I52.16.1]|uniref:adenine nucleotide alpha hydrolase n=1 Tax=Acuticoccus sp. I52.16.1 TaxID=2928472 RepID=UPI001FD26D5E|nr:adenine nucleotide alpha hydrolase [Acuticoccus sp. I52.16.1]UOM33177.1 adenine nucleotide alpha hydrolase [Acuticoccus sp. I52.16.1]